MLRLLTPHLKLSAPALSRTFTSPPRIAFLHPGTMSKQAGATQKDITKFASDDGHFRRQESSFRETIKEGGRFPPEKGRYYLVGSYVVIAAHHAC